MNNVTLAGIYQMNTDLEPSPASHDTCLPALPTANRVDDRMSVSSSLPTTVSILVYVHTHQQRQQQRAHMIIHNRCTVVSKGPLVGLTGTLV